MTCTTSSLSGLAGPFAHPLWKMDVAAAELLQWSEVTYIILYIIIYDIFHIIS